MVGVVLDKGTDRRRDTGSTDARGTAYARKKGGLDEDDVVA